MIACQLRDKKVHREPIRIENFLIDTVIITVKSTNAGYVMIQASSGVPVAVPIEAGGGIVALQTVTPGVQEYQPQLVLLPDSRAVDNPPPPYEAVASGYQNLQFDMPPSYEEAAHGEWRTYV